MAGIRRLGLFSLIGLLLAMGLTRQSAGVSVAKLDLDQYRITFDDEFDDLNVSAWGPGTRWIAHTPWHGDFGEAQFVDPEPGFPFAIINGVLRVEARKEADGKWRSGLLASVDPSGSGFSQRLGYFEFRAKFPAGSGVWPAFWLIANSDPHASAELDVVEYYGSVPDAYQSVIHLWPKDPGEQPLEQRFVNNVASGSLCDDFHRYGVDVSRDWTRFYFDGLEVARATAQPVDRGPFFILIDLALGGGWPIDETPNPSYMYVDYVRAYERK